MKEELIRVEYGRFQSEDNTYHFEISCSRGECIGVYVDDHLTSGTAYLNIFKGTCHLTSGKAFSCGRRVGGQILERWILQNSMIVDKHRFTSGALTVRDFLVALGKSVDRSQLRSVIQRMEGPEAASMMRQMELDLPMERSLAELSLLDYYRLCIFRVWLWKTELLVMDRLTEVLRQKDMEKLMQCVQQLLEYGAAVILLDLDETFMFRSSDRIDVVKNRQTCYHLYPEEYGEKLYKILGWEDHGSVGKQTGPCSGDVVLRVSGLTFPGTAPLDLQISGGEIAFLRDENYSTAMQLQSCFLGGQRWLAGSFCLDGTAYTPGELTGLIGTEIGIQIERPDRSNGVLFDNLTGIDNLSISLLSKAGKRIAAGRVKESIQDEASRWFPREALQRPLRTWSLPERLRFSYCKWYLLNPKLLICFFPFAGQETAHHEMIIEMLVSCAERGMAVWVISSGIDAICEKTENQEVLRRLRYLNCIL